VAGAALMGRAFQESVGPEFWDLYADLGRAIDPVLPPELPLPKFRRRDRARARLRQILAPILAERRQHPDRYDDFLQDFVDSRYQDGAPVEDEVLLALMLGLTFAGHETTAGQGAWTIIQLLQHPAYLDQVQAEIEQVLPPGTRIDMAVLGQLKHVEWAVKETMRMRPSADILMRQVEETTEFGDHAVPPGWRVQVAAEVAHFLPDLFPDPHRYDPLRYAPGREEDRAHRFSLIGFGGGRHKCAGMNFANYEMTIITALLFQQFDLELITRQPQITRSVGANRPTETWIRYRTRPAGKPGTGHVRS
jgi:sterol 14-demethylase